MQEDQDASSFDLIANLVHKKEKNGPMLSNMRNNGEPESTYRIIDTGLLAEITYSELGLF